MLHVRVSDDLKSKLEKESKASGRSINAEVVFRLEESLRRRSSTAHEREKEAFTQLANSNGDWKTALRDMLNILDNAK